MFKELNADQPSWSKDMPVESLSLFLPLASFAPAACRTVQTKDGATLIVGRLSK